VRRRWRMGGAGCMAGLALGLRPQRGWRGGGGAYDAWTVDGVRAGAAVVCPDAGGARTVVLRGGAAAGVPASGDGGAVGGDADGADVARTSVPPGVCGIGDSDPRVEWPRVERPRVEWHQVERRRPCASQRSATGLRRANEMQRRAGAAGACRWSGCRDGSSGVARLGSRAPDGTGGGRRASVMAEGNRVRSGGEGHGASFDREAGRAGGGWHGSRRATGPHATACDTLGCCTAARRTGVCHWAATRWRDGGSGAGGPVRAGVFRTGAVGTGPVGTGVTARGTSESSVWGQLEWALRAARQNPTQQSASPGPAAPQHATPQGAAGPRRNGGTEGAVRAGASAPGPSAPGSPHDVTSELGFLEAVGVRIARRSTESHATVCQATVCPCGSLPWRSLPLGRRAVSRAGSGVAVGGVGRHEAEGAAPRIKGPGARLCCNTKFPTAFPAEFWFAGEADLRTHLCALFGWVAPASWRVPQASPGLERGGSVSVWRFHWAIP
jgi:hypothetical protein